MNGSRRGVTGGGNEGGTPSVHPSLAVYLDDPDAANVCLRRPIKPHTDPSNVHLSIQRRTSSHGVRAARLLGHPLVIVLEIDSGCTHRE